MDRISRHSHDAEEVQFAVDVFGISTSKSEAMVVPPSQGTMNLLMTTRFSEADQNARFGCRLVGEISAGKQSFQSRALASCLVS